MSFIVYPSGQNPLAQVYKFYGGTEELRFDQDSWTYTWVQPDGSLIVLDGVTHVCHILDKSHALMPWAVKKALAKCKRLLKERGYVIPQGDSELGVTPSLFEGVLDEIIEKSRSADKEELDAAAEIGSIAHNWIEEFIHAILEDNDERRLELLAKLPTDERAANACIAACEWMVRHNVRWIATERKIFSRQHRYAGTMDGLARVDGCDDPECCGVQFKDRLTLVDWKTSNYLYIEYLFQTAAYQQAHQEETGEQIEDRWVIRLGKDDAEFDPWHVPGKELFEQDLSGYLACLTLYRISESVRERVAKIQAARVAYRRAVAKAERDAANKIACPASKTYKGIRKKKGCNGLTEMCKACDAIFTQARLGTMPQMFETED
jgi:hypothetical protein